MSARMGLGFSLLGLLLLSTVVALAGSAMVTWQANTEIDLAGYKVYSLDAPCPTSASLPGPAHADVGKATTFIETVPDTVAERCYATTAYDLLGNESGQSVKASKTFAQLPPTVPPSEPVLALADRTASSLTIAFPLIPDGVGGVANIDLRYAPGTMDWGSSPSAPCTTSPCVIPGLAPNTTYSIRAVAYRGELNIGTAVFSTITPPLIGMTLTVTTPPVEPPVEPPPVAEIFTAVTNLNGVLTFQYDPKFCTGRGGTSKSTSALNPATGKKIVTLKCLK